MRIKDSTWCADMGSEGATCFHFLSAGQTELSKPNWDDARFGQFCTSASTFADIKSELEKLCSISGHCEYMPVVNETSKKINMIDLKVRQRDRR